MIDLEEIRRLIGSGNYEVSLHAQQERLEENLDIAEIEAALTAQVEILEQYPDDPRGESCLALAFVRSQPIHVVLGWAHRKPEGSKVLRVITVYKPKVPKWTDPRTRQGRS